MEETDNYTGTLSPRQAQAVYANASGLLDAGRNNNDVAEMLKNSGLGLTDAAAVQMVTKLKRDLAQNKVDRANKDIKAGALWCVGGLIVTVLSYSAVSESGGSYFVCWGAVIFGGIQLIRGLSAIGPAKEALQQAYAVTEQA